jgi:lauroyl/myristoyl acyltransferase
MAKLNILNGLIAIRIALFFGKLFPVKAGYELAKMISDIIASQSHNHMVKAVYANQWVISNNTLKGQELINRVRLVYRSTAHCLFDLYHNLGNPEIILEKVEFGSDATAILKRLEQGKATIFVAPHLSNFDLVGQALALRNFHFQILSYPIPGKGYQFQNQLREKVGMRVTPTSLNALREARQTLRAGGSVLTGLDRPIKDAKYKPVFFGRPSALPVAYIKLALDEKVPVCVITSITKSDGNYLLTCSDPIEMIPQGNLAHELTENAERVLKVTEDFIKQVPEQWSMFYPVWPETLDLVPK